MLVLSTSSIKTCPRGVLEERVCDRAYQKLNHSCPYTLQATQLMGAGGRRLKELSYMT